MEQVDCTILTKNWVYIWAREFKIKKMLNTKVMIDTQDKSYRYNILADLLVEFIHNQRTMNVAYYFQLLQLVKPTYWNKRWDMPIRDILLYDNSRLQTAVFSKDKLVDGLGNPWTRPIVQTYMTCFYFLFTHLKESLGEESICWQLVVKLFMNKEYPGLQICGKSM